MTDKAIKPLKDWLTGEQVAQELGITRQSVNRMFHDGTFKTVRGLGTRPILVVRPKEVLLVRKRRKDAGY